MFISGDMTGHWNVSIASFCLDSFELCSVWREIVHEDRPVSKWMFKQNGARRMHWTRCCGTKRNSLIVVCICLQIRTGRNAKITSRLTKGQYSNGEPVDDLMTVTAVYWLTWVPELLNEPSVNNRYTYMTPKFNLSRIRTDVAKGILLAHRNISLSYVGEALEPCQFADVQQPFRLLSTAL